ncbi:bifunctional 2-polyprenyl-6-hydroxyphenol methylase/3-demethylubiquinol 3-O-methyltransferase UbiG [Saccharibacillus sp. JS10]|uniref:class I SAM-dependent methyltransferase n=1 Tax=Saccharibacillus sp. JS10 TaxID=2950552 RepID=UPI00210A755F|nr:class I SAM-dependent methyltransferase [Saccharibacillus sp. JS10]MCQ4085503.1 class I SAM-dependent methyltransferase [Saccharibacillus sp. JS10]
MQNPDAANVAHPFNEETWNQETYDAWVTRFGTPAEAAERIKAQPAKSLSVLGEAIGDPQGKKIMNLMGSNGSKAIALALLGAEVTVVDFSPGNQRYAQELATAADVPLTYIVSDVLKLETATLAGTFDVVFAEMGILHYFTDLTPFMNLVHTLLAPEGEFVLRDFHPVSTKLISSRGTTAKIRKHKVDGDYFDSSLEEQEASFAKYAEGESPKVWLRKWNLGEIVTSVAQSGLILSRLQEEPNLSGDSFDKGIPKTFTLIARK